LTLLKQKLFLKYIEINGILITIGDTFEMAVFN